ncbi:MAG: hypothetical protein HZA08_04865 [Nitrospirae bacterium]|nr:hypothetical protein [Nitrospirota bacterium]
MVNVRGINIAPGLMARTGAGALGTTSFTMDEATDHCGVIIVIPRTGTLTKIGVRVSTMTTSDTLKVSLEGVDATNGRPDGVVTPVNASGTQGNLSASTTYWVALNGGAGVSVTAGTKVAITVRWNAYVSGNILIAYIMNSNLHQAGFPYGYSYNNTGAVWALNASCPNFGLEYSDGVIEPIIQSWPAVGVNSEGWNSGSNPNRRGLRFSLPYKATVSGVLVDVDSDGDCNIILYDSDGVTVLENVAVDTNIRYSESAASTQYVPFSTPRTLSIDTFYRVVILPASTTNVTETYLFVTDDGANAAMNGLDGGVNFHYTTCNGVPANEASWTQTLVRRPPIALVISQLDNGVGGGGSSSVWGSIR